jgi:hypothetical protein
MEQIKTKYKTHFTDKDFLISLTVGFVILAAALIINFYAGTYATKIASNSVTDIILSNVGVYDLDGFFIYGSFAFFFFLLILAAFKPKDIPFIIKSIALFIITRALFITLTHIGPFPSQITINSDILSKLAFGADLFFSGHTGMPFLIALIFWKDKLIRYISLFFSFGFAVVVLLSHMHYTIDVLSAFFITFGIYHIAKFIFHKDITRDIRKLDL